MSAVATILEMARNVAASPTTALLDMATAAILDSVMTAALGHTAHDVERMWAGRAEIGAGGATLLSLPPTSASPGEAACANATALCWYELDPGFRHAGCHVCLHVLPALLAASEEQSGTVGQTLRRFIFCYEIVARLAMEWDTRPSGIHSHAIFSHLGAVAGVCAAHDADEDLLSGALNLASSMINCGQSWEVSQGGELRNLWPGLAAANAFTLHRAARAGVTTAADRLERGFDALFRRRQRAELGSRFSGPALLQNYSKVLPSCRHLHAAVTASLRMAETVQARGAASIEAVEIIAHQEAAALSSRRAASLLNAQFSLPICVAIALKEGRFDPQSLEALRGHPEVTRLADRVAVATVHHEDYPVDRGASVTVVFSGGERLSERVEIADGDPATGLAPALMLERKAAILAQALPDEMRDRFLHAQAALVDAFSDCDALLTHALQALGTGPGQRRNAT